MKKLSRSELFSVYGGVAFVIVDPNGEIASRPSDSAKDLVDILKKRDLLGEGYHIMSLTGYQASQQGPN